MIPILSADPDSMDPDAYDAYAIADMGRVFEAGAVPANVPSAWHRSRPHPLAGDIEWCWENPSAWEILDGDVPYEWFMERVANEFVIDEEAGEEEEEEEEEEWDEDYWDFRP